MLLKEIFLFKDPTLLDDHYFMQKLSYLRDQHRQTIRYLSRVRRCLTDPKPSTSYVFDEQAYLADREKLRTLGGSSESLNEEYLREFSAQDGYEAVEEEEIPDYYHNQPAAAFKKPTTESNEETRNRRRNDGISTTSSLYSQQRLGEYSKNYLEVRGSFFKGRAKSLHDLRTRAERPKWTPNVTILRPFSMTERAPRENSYSKKFLQQMQEEREQKAREEEEKLKRIPKFKARKPPTTTYVPDNFRVFDEKYIEAIRKKVNANLRARQLGGGGWYKSANDISEENPKRAKPVPLSTYIAPVPIAEVRREQQAHKRALGLLEQAASPNGIREHETLTHIRGKMRHHDCQEQQFGRIVRSRSVPDFRTIHSKLREQLETARRKPNTVPKPFHLSEGKKNRHNAYGQPPLIRPTKAEKLRKTAVRQRMHEQYRHENESRDFWESRREAMEENRRRLAATLGERGPTFDIDERTAERRRGQMETAKEYERQLDEMRSRIMARPLIIEQQEALIQKQTMERKFGQRIADFNKQQKTKARAQSAGPREVTLKSDSRRDSNETYLIDNERHVFENYKLILILIVIGFIEFVAFRIGLKIRLEAKGGRLAPICQFQF
ncbi:unnamed protein product, partial [Mesorhabditis spiculigera]